MTFLTELFFLVQMEATADHFPGVHSTCCKFFLLLRLSVEYATREVSCPSFTVKTLLLSWATKVVSIGNIPFH